jgi:hypothetical protein
LHVEWQKFANEWLFKWHGMTYEGGVTDVDDLRGRRIHYAGIKFGYQQQQIFWQAIALYLDQRTHAYFKRWDEETKQYPEDVRQNSLDGVERQVRQFVTKIVSLSVDTDRRLRGEGDCSQNSHFSNSHSRTGKSAVNTAQTTPPFIESAESDANRKRAVKRSRCAECCSPRTLGSAGEAQGRPGSIDPGIGDTLPFCFHSERRGNAKVAPPSEQQNCSVSTGIAPECERY